MRAMPQRLLALLPTSSQARHLCLTLMLTSAIVLSHFLLSGHDDQRVLELLMLFAASAIVLATSRLAHFSLPASPSIRHALIAMFVLGVCSSLLAFSPRHGAIEVATLFLLLLVARALALEMRASYDAALTLVLRLLGLGSALYLAQVIPPWVGAMLSGIPVDANSLAPAFSNFRFFNHGQTIGLPLLVLLYCRADPRHQRWWFALVVVWWMLAFALAARGTTLALTVGTGVALLAGRRQALPYAMAMLSSAVAGFVVFKFCFTWLPAWCGMDGLVSMEGLVARTVRSPTSARGELWQWTWDMMSGHPWFGVGPMHFAHELATVAPVAHPHAWLPQLGAEWGIPAMLCAAVAAALALRALLRAGRQLERGDAVNHTIVAAFTCTGVAILVDGLVSGLIVMPVSQMFIALYLGCAGGWIGARQSGAVAHLSRPARWCLGSVVALAALGLALCVLPDLLTPPLYPVVHPRYWLAGHF